MCRVAAIEPAGETCSCLRWSPDRWARGRDGGRPAPPASRPPAVDASGYLRTVRGQECCGDGSPQCSVRDEEARICPETAATGDQGSRAATRLPSSRAWSGARDVPRRPRQSHAGCAAAICRCPARVATPTRSPCCCRLSGGPACATTSTPSPTPTQTGTANLERLDAELPTADPRARHLSLILV